MECTIMNYAMEHGKTLVRADFLNWAEHNCPERSLRSFSVALSRLLSSGNLQRVSPGKYKLAENYRKQYLSRVTSEGKEIFDFLSAKYPYSKMCISQAAALSSFMQHIPNIDILIVELDRDVAEAAFEDLKCATWRLSLFSPTEREYLLYAAGRPSLIVKPLITESPVDNSDGVPVPRLEKILVDIAIDPEFSFARDSELYTIYENASDEYAIDKKTMLRYASRRSRKEEIQGLINSTMP